ncbi:hypothetical protein AHAS_Ahas19G0043400 [Arachis hypogaea]
MGGIGKTTLAQLVYNDAKVKEKFDTRVWVCVAENPDLVRLTRTIIGAIDSSPCDQDNFDLLQTNLKGKLTEKTFLVVLDDVWHDQPNMWLWEDFLKPFRCGNNGKMLPSCMQDLVNLQHLDIRGVPRLKEMPKKMSKLKHLNFLSYYIIGEHEENGIRELGTLDNLDGSFDILNLENVKNSDEALEAKMGNKRHINTLKLYWFTGGYMDVETERHILEELQPHENLKELSIEGYRGETFPDWLGLSRYSSMTKLSLQRCKNCCKLPSLGQLPSLQHLEFSELDGLEKIDLAFYNNSGSFEQETPFKCLETLKIEKMAHWREWHFPDEFDGFPELRILSIRNCPVLSGDLPAHLPALEELHIFKCSELVCSLPRAPKIQQLCFGKSRPKRMLEISETQLAQPVLEWVPHLQSLRVEALQILNCHSLISISAYYLPASLTKIHVQGCGSLSSFQLGPLPNLEKLIINECPSMKCVEVPQALPVLLDFTRLTLYSTRVTSIDLWLNSQMEHQSGSSIYTCYVSSHSAVSMEAEKQTSVSEVSLFCVK